MTRLYSGGLALAFLFVAPIVVTPSAMDQTAGGASVHFKTVGEGVWPYEIDNKPRNAQISVKAVADGHWI